MESLPKFEQLHLDQLPIALEQLPSPTWSLKSTFLLLSLLFLAFLVISGLVLYWKISPYIHSLKALKKLLDQWRESPSMVPSDSSILERTPSSNSSNLTVLPPSPSPSAVLQKRQPLTLKTAGVKLAVSVVVDLLGSVLSNIPPFSLAWAPFSSWLIYYMYDSKLLATVGLLEELVPVVGLLPTASLAWIKEVGSEIVERVGNSLAKISKGNEQQKSR